MKFTAYKNKIFFVFKKKTLVAQLITAWGYLVNYNSIIRILDVNSKLEHQVVLGYLCLFEVVEKTFGSPESNRKYYLSKNK